MAQLFLPAVLAGALAWLYRSGRLPQKHMALLLLCSVAASGLLVWELWQNRNGQIVSLERNPSASRSETVPLEVETEGQRTEIGMVIPGHLRTAEEKQALLETAAASLDTQILGKNQSLTYVEWNLQLPASLADTGITLSWSCDHPEWIGWDGTLAGNIPEEGGTVILKGSLFLEEETLEIQRTLTVYPSREPAAFLQRLQKAAEEENDGRETSVWHLPDFLDGSPLTWYRQTEYRGAVICLLLTVWMLLLPSVLEKREEEARQKRRDALQRQYPGFVSRLHLFLCAGLSMRKAFERMAVQSKKEIEAGGADSEIRQEVRRTWTEMENGVSEQDAWTHFGDRCGLPAYRELALLLNQNRRHGGARLPELLEREAQAAMETRKRQARAEGEKASIRLILPMGMMLVIVMALVMIPALLVL